MNKRLQHYFVTMLKIYFFLLITKCQDSGKKYLKNLCLKLVNKYNKSWA